MTQTLSTSRICFVGAGSMAEAIFRGLIEQNRIAPEQISVQNQSNINRLQELKQRYGLSIAADDSSKEQAIRDASVVVLAMKPKDADTALLSLRSILQPHQLLISVIAGLDFATMRKLLANDMPMVRTMPNTSSTIGLGATGLAFDRTDAVQEQLALDIFASVGITSVVEENKLAIVTGVSGSGPAYIYFMMEAMIEAGIQGGLTPEQSRDLTVQTVLGAAQMVNTTKELPAELRAKVTSPNGTTFAALETLRSRGFQEAVIAAVHRAAERADEMGQAIADKFK